MKKILAMAAVASFAGLTACSVSTPAPESTTSSSAAASPAPSQVSPSRSSEASDPGVLGVKEACEKFNSLYVQYRAAGRDSNAQEDVYLAAADAKDRVSGNLKGLFTSMAVLALDQASEIETGDPVSQAAKDAIRDAVFANAGACTAEGVTLTL
ncbi:hypothetical protein LJR078_003030 [Arthrobacter sp. LjRoot78]|uniref:hypothetical protein n=1 Tax=Arthrobacter sp. LjRoot78 TaxID=3342338 RepID=UPI003ECEAD84